LRSDAKSCVTLRIREERVIERCHRVIAKMARLSLGSNEAAADTPKNHALTYAGEWSSAAFDFSSPEVWAIL
jgi:hypothetical protein